MRSLSRLQYLHDIRLIGWIFAFIGSPAALVVLSTLALRIFSRCVLAILAARTIGPSRLGEAYAAHGSQPARANATIR